MRLVPYLALKAAIDQTAAIFAYQSLSLNYLPQADDNFLTLDPQLLVAKGEYAKVPMVTGDCADEGTFFSLTNANVTTNKQALAYIKATYAPKATDDEMAEVSCLFFCSQISARHHTDDLHTARWTLPPRPHRWIAVRDWILEPAHSSVQAVGFLRWRSRFPGTSTILPQLHDQDSARLGLQ